MTDWLWKLSEWMPPLTWQTFVLGLVLFLLTFVGSIAVVSFLLVKLPADYFTTGQHRAFWLDRHPAVRWTGIVAKNVLGYLLVLLGLVMSLPGVPGQGVLTILLGVMLLDFPGKHRLERNIVCRPRVRQAIDRLRARFG
ncbi:MAG TPA: hypothetical protein VGV38_14750, partial [Pyrinomonadaceae bacterium]|nr:hypothetical protein [Pyrinomonadaceae bacterium]